MECNKKDIEQEMKREQSVGRRWTPTDSTETHSRGKLNSRIVKFKHNHTRKHIAPCGVDLGQLHPDERGSGTLCGHLEMAHGNFHSATLNPFEPPPLTLHQGVTNIKFEYKHIFEYICN